MISAAFAFQDSGPRTVFALALTTSLVAMIIMLSMVVITGYVGQISLAQMSLAGVAAFFTARMMANGSTTSTNPFPVSGPGLPWPIASLCGVVVAIIVGVLLGLPAVRIRGVQLAVVTLAFAISLQTLYLENVSLTDLSAGAPASFRPATIFGIKLASTGDRGQLDRPAFTIFVLVVLVVTALAVANLRRNGTGRRFLAVRANERGRGGLRHQRVEDEAAGVRHRRRDRRDRRRDARVQAERRVVGELRLPVEHRVPRVRLPRRHHLDQRRDHRRPARPGRA